MNTMKLYLLALALVLVSSSNYADTVTCTSGDQCQSGCCGGATMELTEAGSSYMSSIAEQFSDQSASSAEVETNAEPVYICISDSWVQDQEDLDTNDYYTYGKVCSSGAFLTASVLGMLLFQ